MLSGHTEVLLLGFGLASVILTLILATRMNIIDEEGFPSHLFSRLPGFFLYLMKEIFNANISVIKSIISNQPKAISPQWIKVPLPQKTDLGRVIYANSITLTPGTVSVELGKTQITVHALTKDSADDLLTGSMAEKILDRVKNN
ncbi:MAG: Na+/H+ antiporter subunit E, partial [Gammaproteobacteria bacterium]|nr:Na+/H+ antiporter subunit E [Gammaproteobacteria bacterium]